MFDDGAQRRCFGCVVFGLGDRGQVFDGLLIVIVVGEHGQWVVVVGLVYGIGGCVVDDGDGDDICGV